MNTFRVSMRLFGAYHVNSSGAKIKVRIRWAHRMSKEKMYLLRTNRDLESSRTYIMDLPSVETLAIEMTHPDVRGKFQFDQEIYKFIEESVIGINTYFLMWFFNRCTKLRHKCCKRYTN